MHRMMTGQEQARTQPCRPVLLLLTSTARGKRPASLNLVGASSLSTEGEGEKAASIGNIKRVKNCVRARERSKQQKDYALYRWNKECSKIKLLGPTNNLILLKYTRK